MKDEDYIRAPFKATLSVLNDIDVETYPEEQPLKASEIWKDQGAVIMIVRRPGCPMCRVEAMNLSSKKRLMTKKKFRLIGVSFDGTYIEPFKEYFKADEFFVDKEKSFYKAIGAQWSGFHNLAYPSAMRRFKSAMDKVDWDLKGEGRQLGGVIVVGPGDTGVIFEHRERVFGDHADVEDILQSIYES